MDTVSVHSGLSTTPTHIDLDETNIIEEKSGVGDWKADQEEQSTNMDLDPVNPSNSSELNIAHSHAGDTGSYSKDEDAQDVESLQTSEKQYEVQWDGDLDPGNPKSMRKARKWLIVLIVSSCSLCV